MASIQRRTSLLKFEGWTDRFQNPDFRSQPISSALSLSLIVIESNVEKTWKTTKKPPVKRKKRKKRANPETELPDTKNELPDTKIELRET